MMNSLQNSTFGNQLSKRWLEQNPIWSDYGLQVVIPERREPPEGGSQTPHEAAPRAASARRFYVTAAATAAAFPSRRALPACAARSALRTPTSLPVRSAPPAPAAPRRSGSAARSTSPRRPSGVHLFQVELAAEAHAGQQLDRLGALDRILERLGIGLTVGRRSVAHHLGRDRVVQPRRGEDARGRVTEVVRADV